MAKNLSNFSNPVIGDLLKLFSMVFTQFFEQILLLSQKLSFKAIKS
jgi:hypothetical protein